MGKLAVSAHRFIQRNLVDFVAIPLLSALIVYFEERSDIGGSVKMLDQKMRLDAISKLLLLPNFRYMIWCATLIGYRHLALDYMKTRDAVIRQETLSAFQRWITEQNRVSNIPPAA